MGCVRGSIRPGLGPTGDDAVEMQRARLGAAVSGDWVGRRWPPRASPRAAVEDTAMTRCVAGAWRGEGQPSCAAGGRGCSGSLSFLLQDFPNWYKRRGKHTRDPTWPWLPSQGAATRTAAWFAVRPSPWIAGSTRSRACFKMGAAASSGLTGEGPPGGGTPRPWWRPGHRRGGPSPALLFCIWGAGVPGRGSPLSWLGALLAQPL